MTRFFQLLIAPLSIGLGLAAGSVLAESSSDELAQLVDELVHDDFAAREAATRKLSEVGLPALPFVIGAALGDDPEVLMRSQRILQELFDSFEPVLVDATRGALLDLVESADLRVAKRGEELFDGIAASCRERSIAHLANLGHPIEEKEKLKNFRLKEDWKGTDRDLRHLLRFPEIVKLNVSHRTVGNEFMDILPHLPQVEWLYIGHTGIAGPGLVHLKAMPSLKYLSLQALEIGDAEAAHVAELERLEHLGFDYTKVTDAGLVHVANLKSLQTLWLNGLEIEGPGLAHLKELPNLNKLIFAKSPFNDEGMPFLAELTRIEQLGLDGTKITDAGVKHLESLVNLKRLFLDQTKLSDASIPTLAKLTSLEGLQIPGCEFTPEGIKRLHEALPKCDITSQ